MLVFWFMPEQLSPRLTLGRGGDTAFVHGGGVLSGALLILLFKDNEFMAQHRVGVRSWQRGHFHDTAD